jgi:hypothetical protein
VALEPIWVGHGWLRNNVKNKKGFKVSKNSSKFQDRALDKPSSQKKNIKLNWFE